MPDLSGRALTPDERNDLANASIALIFAATDANLAECERIVSAVGNEYGHNGVGLLCCTLAAAVAKMAGLGKSGPDSFTGFRTVRADGQVLAPEALPDEMQPVVWAHRFVALYANEGPESALPMFHGMLRDRQEALDNVSALIGLAGEYGRGAAGRQQRAQARLN